MQPGQKFMAVNKYSGKKRIFTVQLDYDDYILCQEITKIPHFGGKPRFYQIFRSVFDIRTFN